MANLMEFKVVEPPTSDGVQERVRAALNAPTKAARNLLTLTVLSNQEVPASEPRDITVRIKRPTYNDNSALTVVEGKLLGPDLEAEIGSVVLNVDDDPIQPAQASVLTIE